MFWTRDLNAGISDRTQLIELWVAIPYGISSQTWVLQEKKNGISKTFLSRQWPKLSYSQMHKESKVSGGTWQCYVAQLSCSLGFKYTAHALCSVYAVPRDAAWNVLSQIKDIVINCIVFAVHKKFPLETWCFNYGKQCFLAIIL